MRDNRVTFMKLMPNGAINIRHIKQSDMMRCPHFIMVADHYREDGSCKCDDPAEQERLIRECGYKKKDFKKVRRNKK